MKKKLLSLSVVALMASMLFGTVALASDQEDVATGTDAVIEEAADEDTTEIEVVDETVVDETVVTDVEVIDETTEDVESNEIEAKNGWVHNGSVWNYYENGVKVTGWYSVDNAWHYFDEAGAMQTGWLRISGAWYCFDSDGVMQTGWLSEGGYWYYFSSGGKMQTGWTKIGSAWYYFTEGGKMVKGWKSISGSWYYFGTNGKMVKGWKEIDGSWYYFKDGAMLSNTLARISGTYYKFSKNGTMYIGWYSEMISGYKCWFYFGKYGLVTGWKKIGNYWYYFEPDTGIMITGSWEIDGTLYFFKDDGRYEGTNSSSNHCQVSKVDRTISHYTYGDATFVPIDAYYNNKGQLVLDAIVANRCGSTAQLGDCYITVYDSDGNIIAYQYFDRSDFTCPNNTVKDISFTFKNSKIVDLRYGAEVESNISYGYYKY